MGAAVTAKQTEHRRRRRRAHAFYRQAVDESERAGLDAALDVEGVDQEIAILRLRLRTLLRERPDDLPLIMKGIDMLAKTVATRYKLSPVDESELIESLSGVVRSLGVLWPEDDGGA